MKKIIFLALTGFSFGAGYAQNTISITSEPKPNSIEISTTPQPPKSTTNVLKIAVDKSRHLAIMTSDASVDIEGYDGNELIIEAVTNKFPRTTPEEATGLTFIKLNNRPAEDNTIGYRLLADNALLVQIGLVTKCKYLHIKVPNHIYLFSIDALNGRPDGYLTVKNIEGPFQVDGFVNKTYISNVAGPFKIAGKSGTTILSDILWNPDSVWPFTDHIPAAPYMITPAGDIDISLPEDLKASISFMSANGRVYSDLNLIQGPKPTLILNGGGAKILTDSHNGNTYLKAQKK
jgi:hypothetical protein